MKIKGFTGPVPGTNPTKSIMTTLNKQTGGTVYAKGFMQNRQSQSQHYRQCDGQITFLDSLWHDLPAGPPGTGDTKADWDQWVSDNAWAQPCGCTGEAANGQTLFRTYNLFAWIRGLPVTNNVFTFGTRQILNPESITLENYGSPPQAMLVIQPGPWTGPDGYWLFNLGLCTMNPIFTLTNGQPAQFPITTGPGLVFYTNARPGFVSVCTYSSSGAPDQGTLIPYLVF